MDDRVGRELGGGGFPDRRLKTRPGKLLGDPGRRIGATVPMACRDRAATEAADRSFSNRRVDEGRIPAGHFAATRARFAGTSGPTLVLNDTTGFSSRRDSPEAIGRISITQGRHGSHTACGALMHSSPVPTSEGVPPGLAAVESWTREEFKGTDAPEKGVNPARIPIEQEESVRWLENLKRSTRQLGDASRCVHIGDREGDLFELFCAAQEAWTHSLVRTCVDRLAGGGGTTISGEMEREPIRGGHEVGGRDDHGRASMAKVHLRFCRMTVHPPIGKHRRYPALSPTVIHAHVDGTPEAREPIRWKLLTNRPVEDLPSAIEELDRYARRRKIETLHKVLKSGCRAEQSRLRTAEPLTNMLALLCIVGWRVFRLTMVNRATPEAPAEVAVTRAEIEILDRLAGGTSPPTKPAVSHDLVAIAKPGGYLARAKDPPPGNVVIRRGLTRLMDIHLGFELSSRAVGN
jgi:Transposase DNA-binding